MSARDYPWLRLTKEMASLIKDEKISIGELGLFLELLENTNEKSYTCYMSQADMAEVTGKKKQVISRNIKKLCDLNLVGRTSRGYMVNPTALFVGHSDYGKDAAKRYTGIFKTTIFTERKRSNTDEQE